MDIVTQLQFQFGLSLTQVYILGASVILFALAGLLILFLILRVLIKKIFSSETAFDMVVLEVAVPKFSSEEAKQGAGAAEPKSQQELAERISIMETIFSQIAGLSAQSGIRTYFRGRSDHLSFEIVLKDRLIYFYVVVPRNWKQFIEEQISAQLPDSQITPVADYNIFRPDSEITGTMIGFKKEYIYPIKTYKKLENDSLNSLTNALSDMDEHAGAAIQYVVRSARGEWRKWGQKAAAQAHQGKPVSEAVKTARNQGGLSEWVKIFKEIGKEKESQQDKYQLTQMEQEIIKGIEDKASKGGLDVNIRVVVSAKTETLATAYLDNIVSSFSQFNIYEYGNAFKRVSVNKKKLITDFIYRHFDEKHKVLLNTEEMTSVFHFPLGHTDTPNIRWLQAKSAPVPSNMPKEGLYLGDNWYRSLKTPVYMKQEDRRRHTYVIGMTGTGKSKWLDSLALQDIHAGRGVCFIDPHGDDIDLIMSAIPKERMEDVVIFDPSDYDRPVGLNMLEYDPANPQQKAFAVDEMLQIFDRLYDLKATGGPIFEQYMRNALLLIMDDPQSGSTLLEVSKVLADAEFRKYKLSKCKTPVVKEFWEKEAQKAGGEASLQNMVPYITSKMTPFLANDLMRPIISQQTSSFNFRQIMDEKKILLVKLAKGKIGDINANLLGMIIVGKILMAALGRSDMPEKDRHDFYLYIDEFQNFLTESINTILSEARKYRLNLIIAHQFLGQLEKKGDEAIKNAIFGNVGTKVCFRIGVEDAAEMEKEFSPVFNAYDLMNVPAYNNFVKLLIDNANPAPFSMKIPYVGDMFETSDERAQQIRNYSRLKYGRDRNIVEAEVLERGGNVIDMMKEQEVKGDIDDLFNA